MKKWILAAALVIVLVMAAGCGGGGGGGGDELTADEYSAQLNAICEKFNKKQDEIGEPQSLEDVAELGPKFLDEFDNAIAEVEDLNPPSELEEPHNEFVETGKQQRDLLQQVVDAAKDGDEAKAQELGQQGDELDNKSDAIATDELNAPACAED